MKKLLVLFTFITLTLPNLVFSQEGDCSQYSKIFPLKYNECMAKLNKNNKDKKKSFNLDESKSKLLGGLKNLNKKYKELREKAPKTLSDATN